MIKMMFVILRDDIDKYNIEVLVSEIKKSELPKNCMDNGKLLLDVLPSIDIYRCHFVYAGTRARTLYPWTTSRTLYPSTVPKFGVLTDI